MTSIESLLKQVLESGNWPENFAQLSEEQDTLDTINNWMHYEVPIATRSSRKKSRLKLKRNVNTDELHNILPASTLAKIYTSFKQIFYFALLQSVAADKTELWKTYWETFLDTFIYYKAFNSLFSQKNLSNYLGTLPLPEQQQLGKTIIETELKFINFGILNQTSLFINKVNSAMFAQIHQARNSSRNSFVFPEFNLGILVQTNPDELFTVIEAIDKREHIYLYNHRIFQSHAKANSVQSSWELYFLDIKPELIYSLKSFFPVIFEEYESKKLTIVKTGEYTQLNQLITELLTELGTGDEITLDEATKVVQEEMTVVGLSGEEISAYIKKIVTRLSHFEYIRLKRAFRRSDTKLDSMIANLDALFDEWEKSPKL